MKSGIDGGWKWMNCETFQLGVERYGMVDFVDGSGY